MTQSIAVSVIVPAYDEASRIERMLGEAVSYFRARGRSVEILVVDDGSQDDTSAVVRGVARSAPEVRLIRLAQNHGKGYAVRTGMVNASGARVLFADADGATPMAEIERLDQALDQGADVAVGSRAFVHAGVQVKRKWYRHVMGRTFHGMVALLSVRGVRDTQCGFKLFRRDVAVDLFSVSRIDGYGFDLEILYVAKRRGYRIAEIPVNWNDQAGSKVRVLRDGLRMWLDLLAVRRDDRRGLYAPGASPTRR